MKLKRLISLHGPFTFITYVRRATFGRLKVSELDVEFANVEHTFLEGGYGGKGEGCIGNDSSLNYDIIVTNILFDSTFFWNYSKMLFGYSWFGLRKMNENHQFGQ